MEKESSSFSEILSELEKMAATHKSFQTVTISASEAFDDLYFRVLTEREKIIKPQTKANPGSIVSVTPSPPRSYLPQLNIPPFDGEIENFPGFISLYDAIIHNNNSLSAIEKFSFLLSYLRGRALKLAQTVAFAPDNYTTVYDLLKAEFSNLRVVAAHYLNTCLERLAIPELAQFILLHWSLKLLDTNTRADF